MCTPIIASDVTGISDIFSGLPGCFLVDPDDTEEFASAVRNVIQDDVEMPRDAFRQVFDIETNYAEYNSIYYELARK
jgi:glycosyltransferase involved in cell wall biosynthesis